MNTRPITSREYKVMLDADKFVGGKQEFKAAANSFWKIFSAAIGGQTAKIHGAFDVVKKRLITFYDTEEKLLYEHAYIFRERIENNKREATLKFRHPDRYYAQDRDMRCKGDDTEENLKFEEDIKSNDELDFATIEKPKYFVSLYSHSNKCKIKASKTISCLHDLAGMFPDFKNRLGGAYNPELELQPVNNFSAHETVYAGAGFDLGANGEVECECALINWRADKQNKEPLVVEFSFRYAAKKEKFSGTAALQAYNIFQLLQSDKQLKQWADLSGLTKTRFVYK